MKEKEIRTIKMDCTNCKLIIIRQDNKKIIVDVSEDIMSVQKEQQMETSNLPEKDEREY